MREHLELDNTSEPLKKLPQVVIGRQLIFQNMARTNQLSTDEKSRLDDGLELSAFIRQTNLLDQS